MSDHKTSAKDWLKAMRLRTLPLAASCSLMGSAVAFHRSADWGLIFILCLLTTLFLQILSNLANDYGDFSKGVDNEHRVGPARALQTGAITKEAMQKALVVFSALSLISGLALLWVSFGKENLAYAWAFLALGIFSIAAAIKYTTGKNPYGYRGLGDVAVFIFFGLVGVMGTAFLQTKSLDLLTVLPAIAVGGLSTAVLNLNNLRDHVNDKNSGKRTTVVALGFEKGKVYHLFLITFSLFAMIAWLFLSGANAYQMFALIPAGILIPNMMRVSSCTDPQALDPELKKVAIATFLISLLTLVLGLF